MKPRLIRALQRGGVTAEVRPDLWGVWRAPDRRGRVIGTLSGADVDVLRFRKHLKPLGTEIPMVLIWSGAVKIERAEQPIDIKVLTDANPIKATLLEIILRKTASPAARDAFRQACERFRYDIEHANNPSAHVTMNWERLGAEARPSPSSFQHGSVRSQSYAAARRRLAQLADRLSSVDLSILELTVIREVSRPKLAKTLGLRPAIVERRASGVLQALVEFYANRASTS